MPVIETQGLRKDYGGIEALKGVSLTVEPGQIYGLIGQNGAGKSTLVKILLGIVRKTDGDAYLLGEPVGTADLRKKVGFLPEDHAFPGYHSARSILDFYGRLYGMSADDRRTRMNEALDVVGLRKRMDSKVKSYSKGMKQRLGIAQAFFHDPEVIFLDEPTDGVDPVGRKDIRELLVQLKGEGRTIFVNSHLLEEMAMIADRVAILHKGEVVRQGTVADITRRTDRFEMRLADGDEFPAEAVRQLGYPVTADGATVEVELLDGKGIDPVLALLSEQRLRLRHLYEKKQTLEDVYVSIVDATETRPKRAVRAARPTKSRRDDR